MPRLQLDLVLACSSSTPNDAGPEDAPQDALTDWVTAVHTGIPNVTASTMVVGSRTAKRHVPRVSSVMWNRIAFANASTSTGAPTTKRSCWTTSPNLALSARTTRAERALERPTPGSSSTKTGWLDARHGPDSSPKSFVQPRHRLLSVTGGLEAFGERRAEGGVLGECFAEVVDHGASGEGVGFFVSKEILRRRAI